MNNTSPSQAAQPFTPLTADEELRLWPLCLHARHLVQQLRYVDYHQAEEDAALLAAKLQGHYSANELNRVTFHGVPRGGLIVQGLLAYQLDLKPQQLHAAPPPTADLLCIVDDCALTGKRIQETLSELNDDNSRITVALLYAPPGLCSALEAANPQVERCIAARDLAEKTLAQEETREESRMRAYLGERPYPRPVENVAFAWNEPNSLIMTPFDDKPSHQWRFLPPHKCLKNRRALGLPPAQRSALEWIVPQGIVYGWFPDVLYLLDTTRENIYRLDGLVAACWRSIAGYGSFDAALGFLQEQYAGELPSNLAQRLAANLADFSEHHLIQPANQPS